MSNFNLNKVILGGRLTSDVELKQTQSGISFCSFSIAINRKYAKDGEQQADFINCQAWRNTAEFIAKYFQKGSPICVIGAIQSRSYQDKQGNKRTATEVAVEEALFVGAKNASQATEATDPTNYTPHTFNAPQSGFEASQSAFEDADIDDSLPF